MHPRDEDDAGHSAVQEELDVFVLAYSSGGLGAEHCGESVLSQMRLHHLRKCREDRIRKLGGHKANKARLASQTHGTLVSEDIEGCEDSTPGHDRGTRPIIEHPRHRCLAHARHLRDVGERGSRLLGHDSTIWAARGAIGTIGP